MSVARRELKTIDELQAWIESHADSYGAPQEGTATPYRIVRRPPRSGAADWHAVSHVAAHGFRTRWHSALRHAIGRAQLLFDAR